MAKRPKQARDLHVCYRQSVGWYVPGASRTSTAPTGTFTYYVKKDYDGQRYGQSWNEPKDKWIKTWFMPSSSRHFWQHNRYWHGSRHRHKSGSKYTIRKKTHIKHKYGRTTLYPGDKVAINSTQGWAKSLHSSYIRCDGYYRKGKSKFIETHGGYVYNDMNRYANNYHINTK